MAADWRFPVEVTGFGVVVFLVGLFAPGLTSVLNSVAFRIRASGKAELLRAERESGSRSAIGPRGAGRGRRG